MASVHTALGEEKSPSKIAPTHKKLLSALVQEKWKTASVDETVQMPWVSADAMGQC